MTIQSARTVFQILCCVVVALPISLGSVQTAHTPTVPAVDHHQHLFSPGIAALISRRNEPVQPITARDLIARLDDAGIKRAVVHSVAYIWSQASRKVENDDQKVQAENDWTSRQVAAF